MSNWSEFIYTKEGFKVGLYSFSIQNGLRYKGTIVNHNSDDGRVIYLVPSRLKELMSNPSAYLDNPTDEVFVWLNEAI